MKAFRLIGMALVAVCLCMNFASCSNEDMVAPEDPQEEKYVTVGLGCTGEFLEFSNSPLSRTTAEELYGIQVYALAENGTNSDGSICYLETPYAHGVFVSLDNVNPTAFPYAYIKTSLCTSVVASSLIASRNLSALENPIAVANLSKV